MAIAGGGGLAVALAEALPRGLTPLMLDDDDRGLCRAAPSEVAGYIHLGALRPGPTTFSELGDHALSAQDDLFRFFANLKAVGQPLRTSRGFVLVTTKLGLGRSGGGNAFDPVTGGHAGMLKSLALEWPEVMCRVVDFDAGVAEREIVRTLAAELRTKDGYAQVAYADGRRHVLLPSPSKLDRERPNAPPLCEDDVVLVTGGARGITAEVVFAVAERWRPTFVVVGRTTLMDEDPRYRGVSDTTALKREIGVALAESGQAAKPAAIERTFAAIARQREVRANLRRLSAAGSRVAYVSADVGDRVAVERVVTDAYDRFGRIDGVIHGAGVVEDKLLADKDRASFERVLKPKVEGAVALARTLRLADLRFLCFFSSTAALHGNAGQCDYAAANEILNRLAQWLNSRTPARVWSMNWGPWEPGVGMVDKVLARRFREKGVTLASRQQGAMAFVDELAFGHERDVEVVFD